MRYCDCTRRESWKDLESWKLGEFEIQVCQSLDPQHPFVLTVLGSQGGLAHCICKCMMSEAIRRLADCGAAGATMYSQFASIGNACVLHRHVRPTEIDYQDDGIEWKALEMSYCIKYGI